MKQQIHHFALRTSHFALFLLLSLSSFAQVRELSEQAQISLITCDVSSEVYAMYGHSAIRVLDQQQGLDIVFNYGLFSFSEPNFIYRFAKGRTDYLLGAQNYAGFARSYRQHERSFGEQILNLTADEKQRLFDFLLWNVQPENAEYRYNFLYDNCATRVRDAIEKCISEEGGEIIYGEKIGELDTFRDLVDYYQAVAPWTNFGIHLLLGSPTDIQAGMREQMFLPPYLETQYAQSSVRRGEELSPLCEPSEVIYQAPETKTQPWAILHMPSIVFAVLLLYYIIVCFRQWALHNIRYTADYPWLILNGAIGVILVWFFFCSELPAMRANYNLLWAGALNLPFAFIWMRQSWRSRTLRHYWLVPAAMSIGFLLSAPFLPQSFPLPIYLFVLISALRSSFILFKTRK